VTNGLETEWYPIWTPDGERIVYNSTNGVWWTAADGTGQAESLASNERNLFPWSWSRDGERLILLDWDTAATGFDVSVLEMSEDERRPEHVMNEPDAEGYPELSPDGRWLAYATNESGQWEVYISPFPAVASDRQQVSIDGGLAPAWSPSGRELFYRRGIDCVRPAPPRPDPNDQTGAGSFVGCEETAMMAVTVETNPALSVGIPQQLFEDTYYSFIGRQYDVDSEGRRFLMIKNSDSAPRELIILRNWAEDLKELVPAP